MSLTQALKVPLASAGPQSQERPVASPQHRNRLLQTLSFGTTKSSLEPQKVMLPGAVGSPPGLGATAAAALAAMRAMGSPPGLDIEEEPEVAEDEEECAGSWDSLAENCLPLTTPVESSPEGEKLGERSTVFSNSGEFTRTLEQLLRLRAENVETSPSSM